MEGQILPNIDSFKTRGLIPPLEATEEYQIIKDGMAAFLISCWHGKRSDEGRYRCRSAFLSLLQKNRDHDELQDL
eukprot:5337032-Pyramimonas_sp.AAC.1